MNLTQKINKLCKIFKKQHYFFAKTKDNNIMLRFEDENETYFEFRGPSMHGAVREAEEYAQNEINQELDVDANNELNSSNDDIEDEKTVDENQQKLPI
jgi:hypothetical protein